MTFSLEIVPPSGPDKVDAYKEMLAGLSQLAPDTVAVTMGAGQTAGRWDASLSALDAVQNGAGVTAIAHFPGLYETRQSANQFLLRLRTINVTHIMALRGEEQPGRTVGDFPHASDLAAYIKQQDSEFSISGACYPTQHPDSIDWQTDLAGLKLKIAAGTSQLISQMFFANQEFYEFVNRVRDAGIVVPIVAGVMPLLSTHLVDILTNQLGISLTPAVQKLVDRYADDSIAFRQAGIEWTIDQIRDLQQHEVAGIHLFSMNDWAATTEIKGEMLNI